MVLVSIIVNLWSRAEVFLVLHWCNLKIKQLQHIHKSQCYILHAKHFTCANYTWWQPPDVSFPGKLPKIVATRGEIFSLKYRLAVGKRSPDPIAAIKGPTSKGKGERRKGVGEGRRGRKKRGGERTGEEREGEDTPMGPQLKTPSAAYGCNYRAMHFSAKHCLAIACHPSVRLSVTLYVGGLWTKAAMSLKRVKIEERLLWTACRKWNHQRSFERYHRRTSTASSSPKFGVRNPNQNCNLKLRANECW